MPTHPRPLNKRQRERAERARKAHEEVLRLSGATERARTARDAHIVALLRDGVRQFTVENETGVPASTVNRLVRVARAAQ